MGRSNLSPGIPPPGKCGELDCDFCPGAGISDPIFPRERGFRKFVLLKMRQKLVLACPPGGGGLWRGKDFNKP